MVQKASQMDPKKAIKKKTLPKANLKRYFCFFHKKKANSVFEPQKWSFCTIHLWILKKSVDFVRAWDTYLSSRRDEKQAFFENWQMYEAKCMVLGPPPLAATLAYAWRSFGRPSHRHFHAHVNERKKGNSSGPKRAMRHWSAAAQFRSCALPPTLCQFHSQTAAFCRFI